MTNASSQMNSYGENKADLHSLPERLVRKDLALAHLRIAEGLFHFKAHEAFGMTPSEHVERAITVMTQENYKKTKPEKYAKASRRLMKILNKNAVVEGLSETICDFLVPQSAGQPKADCIALARVVVATDKIAANQQDILDEKFKQYQKNLNKSLSKYSKKLDKKFTRVYRRLDA